MEKQKKTYKKKKTSGLAPRLFTALLAVFMLVGLLPLTSFAQEEATSEENAVVSGSPSVEIKASSEASAPEANNPLSAASSSQPAEVLSSGSEAAPQKAPAPATQLNIGVASLNPSAPQNLEADAQSSSSIVLWWNSTPEEVEGYSIYRSLSEYGRYDLVNILPGHTNTNYTDTGLHSDTTYWYKITAYIANAESDFSNIVPVTTLSEPKPEAPTLSAQPTGFDSIRVEWTAVYDAYRYVIYRSTSSGGPFSYVGLTQYSTTFVDSGLDMGTTYYYYVIAENYSGIQSDDSNIDSATTYSLGAPVLTATANGSSSANLSWTTVTGAGGYRLYRSTSQNGTYSYIANAMATQYTDTGLSPNTTYWYYVVAYAGSSNGPNSNLAPVTLREVVYPPVSITASALDDTRIKVGWSAVAGADEYRLFRSESINGTYTQVADGITATTYADSGRSPGTTYWYKVQAVKNYTESNLSIAAAATTFSVVYFDAQGGQLQSDARVLVRRGSIISTPAAPPTNGYHSFDGWYLESDAQTLWNFDSHTVDTGEMTLYANWTRDSHIVTFDYNGAGAASDSTVLHGDPVGRPADPQRQGYIFRGWHYAGSSWNFTTPVTQSITLVAQWQQNSAGSSGASSSESSTSGGNSSTESTAPPSGGTSTASSSAASPAPVTSTATDSPSGSASSRPAAIDVQTDASAAPPIDNIGQNIGNDGTPLADAQRSGQWSLLSLLLSVLALAGSVAMTIHLVARHRKKQTDTTRRFANRALFTGVLGTVAGLFTGILFLIFEMPLAAMTWVNSFTPYILLAFLGHLAAVIIYVALINRKPQKNRASQA